MRRTLAALALAMALPTAGLVAPPVQAQVVVVKEGDTLSDIAARHGVGLTRLMQANGISDADLVVVGQRLTIPGGSARPGTSASGAGGSVTVQTGDTLSDIAARHGVGLTRLMQANGISDADLVVVGQRLTIPGGAGRSAAPAAPSQQPTAPYTVKSGETLSEIAARFNTSTERLIQLNGIQNPDHVTSGSRLRIPMPPRSTAAQPAATPARLAPNRNAREHVVQGGESLSEIAGRYGTSVSQLVALNRIEDPDRLLAGTRLQLRGTPPAAQAKPAPKPQPAAQATPQPAAKVTPERQAQPQPQPQPKPEAAATGPATATPAPATATAPVATSQPKPSAQSTPQPAATAAQAPRPKLQLQAETRPEAQTKPEVAAASTPTRAATATADTAAKAADTAATAKAATTTAAAATTAATATAAATATTAAPSATTSQRLSPRPTTQPAALQQASAASSTARTTSSRIGAATEGVQASAARSPASPTTASPTAATTTAARPAAASTATRAGSGSSGDWRSYGPLQIDWSKWQAMGGSYVAPSLQTDGKAHYLAVNCTARKLNRTTSSGQWNSWASPEADFETKLVQDICREKDN
ncbi:LysM peptidoglycan-binding domain-containing protein [Cyanobium sp. ATX 6A2]|nr:LysM peptidoglycan-binding domain-containing protein [Cyanobium sp. ATX 6A2]